MRPWPANLFPSKPDRLSRLLRQALNAQDGEGETEADPGLSPAAAVARALYLERRRREHFFNPDLFADPAWDMLLDLRLQLEAARPPSSSSACIGSTAPASTALRYLIALTREGLVERTVDPDDARCKLTRLSAKGKRLMDLYLSEVALNRLPTSPR